MGRAFQPPDRASETQARLQRRGLQLRLADPDRRVAILESLAAPLFPDLLGQVELPPCKVIENPAAVWQGMTSCIRAGDATARWRGLRIRYHLPYVALRAGLLHRDRFGDAVSTYLHELAHMFGGDSSAAFGHALSQMLAITIRYAAEIADRDRVWTSDSGAGTDREL
jgi:hypothetical protein